MLNRPWQSFVDFYRVLTLKHSTYLVLIFPRKARFPLTLSDEHVSQMQKSLSHLSYETGPISVKGTRSLCDSVRVFATARRCGCELRAREPDRLLVECGYKSLPKTMRRFPGLTNK